MCQILLCTQLLTKNDVLVKYGVLGVLSEGTFLHHTGSNQNGIQMEEPFQKAP